MAINRNHIREVSLCKWLIWLPEIYLVVICIFAVAEIARISLTKLRDPPVGILPLSQSQ